jgi:hypothetical protein
MTGSYNGGSKGQYATIAIRGKRVKIHTLVCTAFHGDPEPGQEVLHGDGVPSHNAASNLRWGTRAENMADMVQHGNGCNQFGPFGT